MQVRNYIGTGILFAGVVTLAGTVLACDIQHLPPGEQAYQLYILSRTASFFAASSLLFSLLVEKNKRASIFYFTTIWALIVTGGIEAIWGLQQVYGIAESNHSRYSLTGSFYNPGPYSGYLAMVFPLCLSECLRLSKLKGKVWWQQVLYYLAMAETLLLLCILPAGMSRSAWIAALAAGTWVCAIHFAWLAKWKEWIKEKKKRIYATAGIGLLALLLASYALFQLKADSASGRWFMWKISCLAIAECPLTGHGSGRFVEAYGQAQENYFAKGDYKEWEERVAGSPEYAFNEYLEIAVEYGIPALLLLLIGIGFCFYLGFKSSRHAACGGIIAFAVFAFSSYPLQVPGFAIAFCLLLVACLALSVRRWYAFLALLSIITSIYFWQTNRYEVCRKWNNYRMYYATGAYSTAKDGYQQLYSQLNDKGSFLFEYGYCLYKTHNWTAAIQLLQEAERYTCDPMVLNIIGKCYRETGNYPQAEHYFIRSTHRLPSRIYPYYLLGKLYAETEYKYPDRLQKVAQTVLNKQPKVHSKAIEEMRQKMEELLRKIE